MLLDERQQWRAAAPADCPVARDGGTQTHVKVVVMIEDECDVRRTDATDYGEGRVSDPINLDQRTYPIWPNLTAVARKADEEDAVARSRTPP